LAVLPKVSFLFSDRGLPDGHRHMNGYGSHTFKLLNAEGHPVYCKFHFKVRVVALLSVLFKAAEPNIFATFKEDESTQSLVPTANENSFRVR
jgi:hypothetical protein